MLSDHVKYRNLGTPPRLTFQARLLHNQEGANAEKGGFRTISSRAFFRHVLLVVEQSSLESQSRGCAKTPILPVLENSCICTWAEFHQLTFQNRLEVVGFLDLGPKFERDRGHLNLGSLSDIIYLTCADHGADDLMKSAPSENHHRRE